MLVGKCQQTWEKPQLALLHPWSWLSCSWPWNHLDYAGPAENNKFLVLIDLHSKWMEAFPMASASASATMTAENHIGSISVATLSSHSWNWMEYSTHHWHRTTPPQMGRQKEWYKLSSSNRSNRVQSLIVLQGFFSPTQSHLMRQLGCHPAELMFGGVCRSHLDLLLPDHTVRVWAQQQQQKEQHDLHAHSRVFSTSEQAYGHNFRLREDWLLGCILKAIGPVSFLVKLTCMLSNFTLTLESGVNLG